MSRVATNKPHFSDSARKLSPGQLLSKNISDSGDRKKHKHLRSFLSLLLKKLGPDWRDGSIGRLPAVRHDKHKMSKNSTPE